MVGAEVFSRILDWRDRGTCVLFGDGAGAVVLEAADEPGIVASALHADGSYNSAYDIWCEKHAYEIMLWVNWAGKMGPITTHYDDAGQPIPDVANVTVGGHTWNIYKGSNGANEVFSFLRTSPATAGEVDVKAILDWIHAQGWFAKHGDVLLDEVQFGWEITSSAGGLDFAVGANTVSFGARYTYGLVDLADIGSIRNRAISLLGGVSMPIGR